MSILRVLPIILLASGTIFDLAFSQSSTGTVKGSLKDDSGGVIPAANLTLVGNGSTRTAQSQGNGTYTFMGVPPGQYNLEVTYPGFAPFSQNVTVTAGATTQLDVQLALNTEKQEVTVSAEPGPTVSVEPENNVGALVIKGADLQSLPDDSDDLSNALQALAGPGAGPSGGQIYIDGFSGGQIPPKEDIREVRINQNPFSAEYDKLGFGRIEILTKAGTGNLHGMLFLNDGNGVFDSRNPFASNKPEYSNRMYGGNVSGPLSKRASFFLDFNERDITNNAITNAVYLDPSTLTVGRINTAVVTPLMNRTIAPRLDYQLNSNNTLTVRLEERMTSINNAGLGGYSLPAPYSSLAFNSSGDAQNLTITEDAVLSSKLVNETLFQYYRNWTSTLGNELPQINVANSFVTGGNGVGHRFDRTHHFELQNNSTATKGAHTIRFGVRARRDSDQNSNPSGFNGNFTFLGGVEPELTVENQVVTDQSGNPVTEVLTSLQQYERNLQLQQAGFTEAQIQTLGGGPSTFQIQAGEPYIAMTRYDAAPFVQDDWRVKPNLTLSLGLRYEIQTLVHDYRDWAPRVGFAWAPGRNKNGRQATVIRGGVGVFYDRIGFGPYEQAALNNGHSQVAYTVYNPAFYPNIPSLSSLTPQQNSTYLVDPRMRADYSIQSAIGVERQLPFHSTAALTYTNTRAEHYMQTVPINTPLPGSYNPLLATSATNGAFPYGFDAGNLFEYEPGGVLRQSILMLTLNSQPNKNISFFANYQLTYASDLPSIPTDPYDFMLDYGRSALDRRHNFQMFGSFTVPGGIHIAPFITIRSGAPYDVQIGEDLYGNTLSNARAAFATADSCPAGFLGTMGDVVCSRAGDFTTSYNPANPTNLVPRNYLTMAGMVSLNTRIYRVFGFGPRVGGNNGAASSGRGGGGRGGGGRAMSMAPSGGMRSFFAGAVTDHRFNLTLGLNMINILNHFNPGGYQGVITSPQFLEATSVNTGYGGGGVAGGGSSAANNRRIEFDLRITF